MRICFITFGNVTDYATLKRATGLAGPLIARGHSVSIVIEDTVDNRARLAFECPDVQALFCERRDRKSDRAERLALARSVDPDVVWICGLGTRNWVKFRNANQRPVCMMDHVELFSGIPRMSRLRRLWDAFVEWRSLMTFDAHICASRYLDNLFTLRLRWLLQKSPTFYYPYAYGKQLENSDARLSLELSTRYEGKKVLLYMGSFYENYGCLDMLEAVERLAEERDDFAFAMMGGGPLKERCRSLADTGSLKGRVDVLGYIPEAELPAWFSRAHAFVCPLRDTIQDWARCPSKLYMYLPFKKPIVTSPIGEALELLREDGFFYEPGDVDQLKDALSRALDVEDWEPTVDPLLHTWESRADAWLEWMQTTFPKVK